MSSGKFLVAFILLFFQFGNERSFAQKENTHYAQFWNEFGFTRTIKKSWVTELNVGQTYSSAPSSGNPFDALAQVYLRGWAHYYPGARWKFSFFLAYFYNRDVPEISQTRAPEIRTAYQAVYYFKKIPYTLNTRLRIEDRKIKNNDGIWESNWRFRTQLRFVYPFNSKYIRTNTIYGIASDEIMVKTSSPLQAKQFFDRNRFTIGAGYSVTDDLQLELTYANEFLPRSKGNEIYNAIQFNVVFNNLIPNVHNKFFTKKPPKSDAPQVEAAIKN